MKKAAQGKALAVKRGPVQWIAPAVGQVYLDRDPRMHGRQVKVIKVDEQAKRVTAARVDTDGPKRLSVISFHILAQKFRLDVPTAR